MNLHRIVYDGLPAYLDRDERDIIATRVVKLLRLNGEELHLSPNYNLSRGFAHPDLKPVLVLDDPTDTNPCAELPEPDVLHGPKCWCSECAPKVYGYEACAFHGCRRKREDSGWCKLHDIKPSCPCDCGGTEDDCWEDK